MKSVIDNLDYLKVLNQSNTKMQKAILMNADCDLVTCLCECVLNCIKGNLNLPKESILKLKKHKYHLRSLLEKQKSLKQRKKILVQKGASILPLLLPAVISLATSLLK